MKREYLERMEQIAKSACSRSPRDIMEYLGFIRIDTGSAVDGFITKRKGFIYYGVNRNLSGKKYDFCMMHEAFHAICGHLDLPHFLSLGGVHMDLKGCMEQKLISSTEREANIGASDFILDTDTLLSILGFQNPDVKRYYQELSCFLSMHSRFQQNPQEETNDMGEEAQESGTNSLYVRLQEMQSELTESGFCLSKEDAARLLEVPPYIIDYKLEALRLRGYPDMTATLPDSSRVFQKW